MSEMASEDLSKKHVFNRGLPVDERKLFGRDHELGVLKEAWGSSRTRIISVVAYGGAGKSALINTWLAEMRDQDYLDAQRVFAWSFYSQGTRDNLVSADPFVNAALSWLGDDSSVTLNPWAKGLRLASLIKTHKFLLVLDGMEPLQHPLTSPDVGGQLTDDSLRALLEELAKPDWHGLCVITTRVPLTDLGPYGQDGRNASGSVMSCELQNLDDRSGAALLKDLIRTEADFEELREAVRDFQGQPLSIILLGNYLRDVHGGNLAGRFDLGGLAADVRQGGHARRVMTSYVQWLERNDRHAQLAILHLIGLFDRPAEPEAMDALLGDTDLEPFTTELDRVGSEAWEDRVYGLRKMGLLNNEIPDTPGSLDAHPLVREHFREELQRRDPDKWRLGNRKLFDYYRQRAPLKPSTQRGMTTLYAAVNHGCAAELHQQVFDSILLKRVWQGRRTYFSTRRLGMTGSDLVALSYFFQTRWTELVDRPVSDRARILILTNAGVRLRQLGRLVEARQCFGAVVGEINPRLASPEELEDASYAAAQFCELLVIAGKLVGIAGDSGNALFNGQRAIEYSDHGTDPYFRMHARSSMAEVYFMLGQLKLAEEFFEEARTVERKCDPRPPFLYSQSLFRYGYYLIETGRAEELLESAKTPGWGTNGEDSSLLSAAIRLLVLGAAHRAVIEAGTRTPTFVAEGQRILDESVALFRTAGYADYTVRGLLERAHLYRARGQEDDYDKALDDLDRADSEAKRGQMDLLYIDVLLQRLACDLKFWPMISAAERTTVRTEISGRLSEARKRMETIQYARRQQTLADLRREVEGLFDYG